MKNLKIGAKIFLGFACLTALLLAIAIVCVISSAGTGKNLNGISLYSELQDNANVLMDVLNETRTSAAVLYTTQSENALGDVKKQLLYCNRRLEILYEYINANPELSSFYEKTQKYEQLYNNWLASISALESGYDLSQPLNGAELEDFLVKAEAARVSGLLAHESISNFAVEISEVVASKRKETISFNTIAVIIVISVSVVSMIAAIVLALIIMRSITRPVAYMQKALVQIGESGDTRIEAAEWKRMKTLSEGRDEVSQCMHAMLVLINSLNAIDDTLSRVADGDLTADVKLQSNRDTMGLALKKMLGNLNREFTTLAESTGHLNSKAGELSSDSGLLSNGSQAQSESVGHLSDSIIQASEKTEKITILAKQAAEMVDSIQLNARTGTDQMNQMIQAASEINTSSQAIGKVIKVIDDIAFQTNILALNAAVEAARAGTHGKGFAVVAEEVRNLATKSAEAAKDTGALIEDTIQKAALGANIADVTSKSLNEIVSGVEQSNAMIGDMSTLSHEQAGDIRQIADDAQHITEIVSQNNAIATRTADAAGIISGQSALLNELVSHFKLADANPAQISSGTEY